MQWGLLGPESLAGLRRTRTLGIASAVRHYNELAVPGMGGVWFVRHIYQALLGIAVAERARKHGIVASNIEVANAIEALGSWLTLNNNDWQRDSRLRGATKLFGTKDISFAKLRTRSAYVTQPMRMATVQPLRELGFVSSSSERFNTYECTDLAEEFIELATRGYRPGNRSVLDNLLEWIKGNDCVNTHTNRLALSSVEKISKDAREILFNQIVTFGEGAVRRKRLMAWMDDISAADSKVMTWGKRPSSIDEEHWRDLYTGGVFFQLRDAAVELLDLVEARLGQSSDGSELHINELGDEKIRHYANIVQQLAAQFLSEDYDVSPGHLASEFCHECDQADYGAVIRSLVDRDGHVLRRSGDRIRPGPAFTGDIVDEQVEAEATTNEITDGIVWPDGMSGRVKNLFYLNADINGVLDNWIGDVETEQEYDDEV